MNKADLINAVSEKSDITQVKAGHVVSAFVAAIMEALAAEESVALSGFGVFGVKERAARSGRNPQTGGVMQLPASRSPYFKAGKLLKDTIKSSTIVISEE
ncbi:HU family DNA-binding protein [Sodalis endosymbiont of Spalangia cameroni]|uniref:HU family DNA-binding protein n=1 Tax=Sodalis praecaptivus TaxID=1239307 RepID=UPI0031F9545E